MLEFIIGCVESELGDRGEYDLSDQYSEIIIQGCLRFRRLGALLWMDRSIQAEGSFGVIKYDRWYKRVVRSGLKKRAGFTEGVRGRYTFFRILMRF